MSDWKSPSFLRLEEEIERLRKLLAICEKDHAAMEAIRNGGCVWLETQDAGKEYHAGSSTEWRYASDPADAILAVTEAKEGE